MRIPGEMFLLINGWMDYLSLLLAALIGRRRFCPFRSGLAAALGAAYAGAAWSLGPWARSIPALGCAALIMGMISFGRQGWRMTGLIFLGGWMLSGAAQWLMKKETPVPWVLALCGALTGIGCLLCRQGTKDHIGGMTLRVVLQGRTAIFPVLRDSGNLLVTGPSGLPVIAVPAPLIGSALPSSVNPRDLSTLPRGGRLIGIGTAAGRQTAMCLFPEEVWLCYGNRKWRVEAAIALTNQPGKWALAPESLFRGRKTEEGYHAVV